MSGEENWRRISLGAQSKNHILSDVDREDIRELLGKWSEYLNKELDENCEGEFSTGKIAVIGFVTGNSASRLPKRVLAAVQEHRENLMAQAIKDGMKSAREEGSVESKVYRPS